jgi:hypothetical protein
MLQVSQCFTSVEERMERGQALPEILFAIKNKKVK